jgi:hypothetical protein
MENHMKFTLIFSKDFEIFLIFELLSSCFRFFTSLRHR